MAKSPNQKLKILYLMKALMENTDEDHPMSMSAIIDYLAECGIEAERKSIYSDIEALQYFGLDINLRKERPSGYYIGERDFELAELKFLVDAVQASKFITTKKSNELIKKLEKLCNVHDGKNLHRQVYVANRIKAMNETVYYTVDDIHEAISANRMISFQYCEWNTNKQLIPRHDGARYMVSPWTLVWDDEYYYMIGFDEKDRKVKYYRVDKIKSISLENQPRNGKEYFDKFNVAEFSKKTFRMFAGEERNISLNCSDRMIGVIIDRFGNDVPVIPGNDGTFKALVNVKLSSQFYGWITALGGDVKITEPQDVVAEYREFLKSILDKYY